MVPLAVAMLYLCLDSSRLGLGVSLRVHQSRSFVPGQLTKTSEAVTLCLCRSLSRWVRSCTSCSHCPSVILSPICSHASPQPLLHFQHTQPLGPSQVVLADSHSLFFQVFPSEQQQSGKLPQELYRLLDPQASVDLPSAHLVSSRQLDNRELDKLFAALGRNKITWRRALVLHEWLLSMGHTPDDRLCTTLIRVCSQHGQTMTALSLYDWMRSSQRAGGAGLVPTVYTYTAAMRAALTGNMIDRAVKVIDKPAAAALLLSGSFCFHHASCIIGCRRYRM